MEDLDILNRYLNAIEIQDLKVISDCVHSELQMINPIGTMNREAYLAFKRSLFSGFPDFKYNPEIIGKNGDYYDVRIKMTGTHKEIFKISLFGLTQLEATNKKIVLPEQVIRYKLRDGKIFIIAPMNVKGGGIIGILRQVGAKLPPQFIIDVMIYVFSMLRMTIGIIKRFF